jgi:hypothetical protein
MMLCPQCGSSDILTSRRKQWGDLIHRVRGKGAFRCRKCRLRFFATASSEVAAAPASRLTHRHRPHSSKGSKTKNRTFRRTVVVLIFVAALVIIWMFLHLLTPESPPSTDSGAIHSLRTLTAA